MNPFDAPGKPSAHIYDSAKSHFKGNFPDALPIEQAYVHIGVYLGWMIEHNLCSDEFEEESRMMIIRFLRREISCTILSELWDGYLGTDYFTNQGNLFTNYYYGGGIYRRDYENVLMGPDMPSLYHVKDTWENFERMSRKISERYFAWRTLIS